ncbi:toxin-activating lysine-acyltransferase [Sulfuricurvum sp.]|uniref:toxin-activating lysine-acyltransferase n=1 Tax=Sulfuricurvum sp. TaxID=2025608 RepID=UPI002627B16A|nr:toxin-activating lysine-acyltransferase [Sulfuricurvum sp.]MDD4950696.1 toxin-activating lysine-acyltransferase [Sulfuricurvum sp.]
METTKHTMSEHDLALAQGALSKLPILGPALWLYAKDPIRKFRFLAEIDWTVFPPIILDQCRLYTRNQIPFAFITWALVSDDVQKRLLSGEPKIAPHEWQSGSNIWLIDVITPFGQTDETLLEATALFPGQKVHAFVPMPGMNPPIQIAAWDVPLPKEGSEAHG